MRTIVSFIKIATNYVSIQKQDKKIAKGISISKIRYCPAAYGTPRIGEDKPQNKTMAELEVKQNSIMRISTGHRRSKHISKLQLLEETGMTSINRMAAATLLREMWRVLRGDLEERRMITATSSMSTMMTRSKATAKATITKETMKFLI
jgi:hypothetical protein